MPSYGQPLILGFNFCKQDYGGSVSASSGSGTIWFPTDSLKYTRWITSGQSGTNNFATWMRDFAASRTIDNVFVYQTNISNINLAYGTSNSVPPNMTVTRSADGFNHFFKFDPVQTTQIRLSGTSTLAVGDEKYINEVISSAIIGQFQYPVEFRGGMEKSQVDLKLESGQHFIINKGNALRGSIELKSQVSTNDVTLFNSLLTRDSEFHIWFNAGVENQFTYSFYPYRFQDFFRVSLLKGANPYYTDNLYTSGLNVKIEIVEVM